MQKSSKDFEDSWHSRLSILYLITWTAPMASTISHTLLLLFFMWFGAWKTHLFWALLWLPGIYSSSALLGLNCQSRPTCFIISSRSSSLFWFLVAYHRDFKRCYGFIFIILFLGSLEKGFEEAGKLNSRAFGKPSWEPLCLFFLITYRLLEILPCFPHPFSPTMFLKKLAETNFQGKTYWIW